MQERQLNNTVIPALQRERDDLKSQLDVARQQLSGFKEIRDNAERFGVTPQEMNMGLQFAASWRLNPGEAIKNILTFAQAKGIKVEGLPNSGVSRELISSVLEEKLGPVLQETNARKEATEKEQAAVREAEQFVQQRPDAATHANDIAVVMQSQNLSLSDAYMQLRIYAAENGFDWSKPLKPQIEAKRNSSQAQPQLGNNYSPGTRQATMPNVVTDPYASPDSDYSDIVDQVLAELNISR